VDARGWGWRYAGRHAWAVSDLDLHITPGERILLLGASGAGKSTFLQGLAGVQGGEEEGEETGTLLVDGVDPGTTRGRAGLVLQDPDSQVILARVGDDVAFGCENLGVPRDLIWPRVRHALAMVGLDVPLAHPTAALSGGQKQRLALAGVLAMQPGLLLLDEPTANLDPDGVREVRASVARVLDETGATFVVIEHRVDVWKDLVDRVVVLGPAGVIASGRPDVVLGEQRAFLAAEGIWVPGAPVTAPARATDAAGPVLVSTDRLTIGRSAAAPVRTDVDVAVAAGEVLAITGPNGAGKSTLALTLGGLLKPVAGRVQAAPALADGAHAAPSRWTSAQLVARIGTVFQDPEHQFLTGTVRDELAVGPRVLGVPPAEATRRIDALLERLRLDRLAAANPFTLSGGEKRRLSVATVLASRPRVLLLDEPTFGQDFRTWQEIVALLRELADDGTGVVAVSHDEAFVRALSDREYALAGITVADGAQR